MKQLFTILALLLTTLNGCSSFYGLAVNFHEEAGPEVFRSLEGALHQAGFERITASPFSHRARIRGYRAGQLEAWLHESPPRFTLGKANTSSFSAKEQRLIDTFVEFLERRPEVIQDGSLDEGASSPEVRSRFLARLR